MSEAPLLAWKGRRVRLPDETPELASRKVPPVLKPGSLFFVPSPLEGWGLDVLLENLPADGAVVVMEKDPELRQRCEAAFAQFLGPRVSDARLFWLETDTEAAVASLFSKLPLSELRRCEFLSLNGAWIIHSARYREVFHRLQQGLTSWWSNRITNIHMGPLWVRNLFDNLRSPNLEFAPWPDWGDASVLVCGAGVTLETALPWVKAHRNQWKILAVDTALSVLKAWHLVPDAVVCVEAQHANLRDFCGWVEVPVPLFADLTSFPPSTRVFGHPPYWFISEFAPLSLWSRWPWDDSLVPRIPPLGSVGVVAAWIAWKLTRGKVLLAGLDFSFPIGKTHARGSPSLTALASSTDRFHPMEQAGTWPRSGVHRLHGQQWLTTPVMEGYAGLLAEQASPRSDRTWIWQTAGISLGLPVWVDGRFSGAASQFLSTRTSKSEADPSSHRTWLLKERKRWESILDAFDQLNLLPHDDKIWHELEARLGEVDYLTFSFPDPQARRSSDWLIRALTQVRWIVERTR